ncbi:hypothetical protein B0H16DRAFT_1265701, partial [Mycena metata]
SLWLAIVWAAGCLTAIVVDNLIRFIIALVVLFGGQVQRLKIQLELTLAVKDWLKLILDISWAWISLSVISAVEKPPGSYWLFLRFVAINFHQKALADCLTENRLGLKALDRLSNSQPAPKRTPYAKRSRRTPSGSVDFSTL